MAREILFRGNRTDNGKWVEGHLIVFPKSKITKIMVWNAADLDFDAIEVRPESVGQFTGKTDKNGKRIFGGDIAKYTKKDGTTAFYEVVWDNELFAPMFQLIGSCSGVFVAGMNERVEIIGNIHDNPELLNGTEP